MDTQPLAAIFDGLTRHSSEGLNLKKRVEYVYWKNTARERDKGIHDWTQDRPIDPT